MSAPHQKDPHDPRNGPGGPQTPMLSPCFRLTQDGKEHLAESGHQPGQKVERHHSSPADPVFQVGAEDPEKKHVEEEMGEIGMMEHGS